MIRGCMAAGSCSGFGEGGVPSLAFGEDVQKPLGGRHVVGVSRGDWFPRVAGRIGVGQAEGLQQPGFASAR
jgi:hypothetical protein